jgi:hypothetical protein
MSIRPFSVTELESLKAIMEKNGWRIDSITENYFRYSIKKDKLLIFTIKLPVPLPVRLNIPFEVVSFKVAICFRFWDLNQNVNKDLLHLMKLLRTLAMQASIEHNFPLEGKESELLQMLNEIMPEPIQGENDNTWINRIRISLMNKRDKYQSYDKELPLKTQENLRNLGLNPTFKLPWELKEGVPKLRASEVLFFSNDEPFDEFFIIEKGFLTYFKDIEYKKFYIRSLFDCYTPYMLNLLFKNTNVNLELLIENWIKFSRMMLNSIIEVIDLINIIQTEYLQFNPTKEIDDNGFEEEINNFPFSPLHYESNMSKGELYPIHNDLFNTPPTNFEVIETMNTYTEAEEMIKNYRFVEATQLLNNSLKVFNKNLQKKIVVSVLLKLNKIASSLNQNDVALNYLQTALGIAKSGDVPEDYIIKIHYHLAKHYFIHKAREKAELHFNVINNFLEKEQLSMDKTNYLGLSCIFLGLINQEQNKIPQAKTYFKKALQLSAESTKIKLVYHLERAKEFKDKGNFSQTQKMLKAGIDAIGIDYAEKKNAYVFLDLILELAEFYIHQRIDSRKALFLLKHAENRTATIMKEIKGIKRAIRWNLLMSDYYDLLDKNSTRSSYYYKQAQILINQLKKIGVSN